MSTGTQAYNGGLVKSRARSPALGVRGEDPLKMKASEHMGIKR